MHRSATLLPELAEQSEGAPASFENAWYALGYSEQLTADAPYPTRLWGVPLVVYRDAAGQPVAVRDVCPHRSAPLSMGEVKDGVLSCFYHGWSFGEKGACVAVPTIPVDAAATPKAFGAAFCATNYAVVEHEGLVWVWKGEVLAADARLLPRRSTPAGASFAVDTTLDYDCEWDALVEHDLASPGRLAPIIEPGPAVAVLLSASAGDAADAAGKLGGAVHHTRFDAPNIVRHAASSGFADEMHVLPVAARRTRVLLRQYFPKGPLLSALLALPGAELAATVLVRNLNSKMAFDEHRGRVNTAPAGGTPARGAAAETERFRRWRAAATGALAGQPAYFSGWDGRERGSQPKDGERFGAQMDDDDEAGTYGLKRSYVQNHPQARCARPPVPAPRAIQR